MILLQLGLPTQHIALESRSFFLSASLGKTKKFNMFTMMGLNCRIFRLELKDIDWTDIFEMDKNDDGNEEDDDPSQRGRFCRRKGFRRQPIPDTSMGQAMHHQWSQDHHCQDKCHLVDSSLSMISKTWMPLLQRFAYQRGKQPPKRGNLQNQTLWRAQKLRLSAVW